MLDSIYTGITGVRSHQSRIDVIANNVANINTVGFKSGRVTFSEVLSTTLSSGQAQRDQVAATNPQQSGLGVQVASIDTVQTQGTMQTTGVDTDLAIEGDGLFVLSDGITDFYSRDGTFTFDPSGRLVDPATGLVVQGKLASEEGVLKGEVENLSIPLDRESKAEATTKIELSGNLDVSNTEQTWEASTRFGSPARLVSTGLTNLDLSDLGDRVTLKIQVEVDGVESESTIGLPTQEIFTDQLDLIEKFNAQIRLNDTLKGKVLFTTSVADQLELRSTQGGTGVTLTVDNGDPGVNLVTRLGLAGTVIEGDDAATSTLINELANVGANLTNGDVIRFAGTKPTGERFSGNFEFERNVTDRMENLLDAIATAYGDVQVGVDPDTGRISIVDEELGESIVGFDINLSLIDNADSGGSGLLGNTPAAEFTTNTQVFDQKGESHALTLAFTKSVVGNEWTWAATVDGLTPVAGNSGKAVFNEDGTLDSFEASDGKALKFTPGGGTPDLVVELGAAGTASLGGLTQFVAPSTASVRDQDGRPAGSLVSINIEGNGDIRGSFTNGDSQLLGNVVLAAFINPGGLRRHGDNLFVETEASGSAREGEAGTEIQANIRSGTIELSNVDLAQQFTELIVTQRGFQASARSITTADELLTELVNLKR